MMYSHYLVVLFRHSGLREVNQFFVFCETELSAPCNRGEPAVHAELGEDPLRMVAHRDPRDLEARRRGFRAEPLGEESEHFAFARGQIPPELRRSFRRLVGLNDWRWIRHQWLPSFLRSQPSSSRQKRARSSSENSSHPRHGLSGPRFASHASDTPRQICSVSCHKSAKLHLRAREMSASSDRAAPAAVELRDVPPAEAAAEDPAFGRDPAEGLFRARDPRESLAQDLDRVLPRRRGGVHGGHAWSVEG